jgi:hypothetical protein
VLVVDEGVDRVTGSGVVCPVPEDSPSVLVGEPAAAPPDAVEPADSVSTLGPSTSREQPLITTITVKSQTSTEANTAPGRRRPRH